MRSTPAFGTRKAFIAVAAFVLFAPLSLAAQGEQIFKGRICLGPDVHTATLEKDHAAAQCTALRPQKNAHYVFSDLDNKTVYQLGGHKKPKAFAGQYVVVVGTLDKDTGTILVTEIFRALAPKVMQARSVYIDCDACPRGMAAAWQSAFGELTAWGKFDVTPDPKKADLIFLFAANPYLGDYATRDGPDTRVVHIEITYMNVVDPHTGENLWGDSRRWGSFEVSRATKDLIVEFKNELQIEENTRKN
jgi:hypothetical protein